MNFRLARRFGNRGAIQLVNTDGKNLEIVFNRNKARFNYEFQDREIKFSARYDEDADLVHKIGEGAAVLFMGLLAF